jgi:hypothetical protein
LRPMATVEGATRAATARAAELSSVRREVMARTLRLSLANDK